MNKATGRFRSWLRDPVFIAAVLILVVILVILLLEIAGNTGFPSESARAFYPIVAALIVAISTLALAWAAKQQLETVFLEEYVSKIYTDRYLHDTYYYLVYTYNNKCFDEVKEKLKADGIKLESCEIPGKSDCKAMYDCLASLQDEREEGLRLYHPAMFQYSAEEKRLDSLLGYLNIIAYSYENKKRTINENIFEEHIWDYLTVMADRDVIKEYMKIMKKNWKSKKYDVKYGSQPPLLYLDKLLRKIEKQVGKK